MWRVGSGVSRKWSGGGGVGCKVDPDSSFKALFSWLAHPALLPRLSFCLFVCMFFNDWRKVRLHRAHKKKRRDEKMKMASRLWFMVHSCYHKLKHTHKQNKRAANIMHAYNLTHFEREWKRKREMSPIEYLSDTPCTWDKREKNKIELLSTPKSIRWPWVFVARLLVCLSESLLLVVKPGFVGPLKCWAAWEQREEEKTTRGSLCHAMPPFSFSCLTMARPAQW